MCRTVWACACSILAIAKTPVARISSSTASANTWNSCEKLEALEIRARATPAAETVTKYRLVRAADTDQTEPKRKINALYSVLSIRNRSSRSSGRSSSVRDEEFMLLVRVGCRSREVRQSHDWRFRF